MIFKPLYLFANQETGTDQLGNPLNELVLIGESVGSFSNWSEKEIALDTRDVTVNNRKIITRATKEQLRQADKVMIENLYYKITEINGGDTNRWRILVVNRYGSETL